MPEIVTYYTGPFGPVEPHDPATAPEGRNVYILTASGRVKQIRKRQRLPKDVRQGPTRGPRSGMGCRMDIETVSDRFENARRSGDGFSARCPCHDDRRNSLSISEGDEGRVLLHCHVGCRVEDIVREAGLTMRDLMPSRNGFEPWAKKTVAATYDYRSSDGTVVFQVVRYVPKGFCQRRPAPDKPGCWNYKLDGVQRILYRTPELTKADPEATVYLPEGEKDADALASLGLVATTSPGGAGKWTRRYSEQLKGRQVVILPDNDEPGRNHAEKVAASLHGRAASVKVVQLPDLPPKGDVSDWLRNGGTAEKLAKLVRATPEWTPATSGDSHKTELPTIYIGGDLAKMTEAAWDAIHRANEPPFLFRHGGLPARIEQDDEGNPVVRSVDVDRMRHVLVRAAKWARLRKIGDSEIVVATDPTDKIVRDVLATPDMPLPVLTRIVQAPVFARDGTLESAPGYHARSRVFYQAQDGFSLPPVGDNPTKAETAEAVNLDQARTVAVRLQRGGKRSRAQLWRLCECRECFPLTSYKRPRDPLTNWNTVPNTHEHSNTHQVAINDDLPF